MILMSDSPTCLAEFSRIFFCAQANVCVDSRRTADLPHTATFLFVGPSSGDSFNHCSVSFFHAWGPVLFWGRSVRSGSTRRYSPASIFGSAFLQEKEKQFCFKHHRALVQVRMALGACSLCSRRVCSLAPVNCLHSSRVFDDSVDRSIYLRFLDVVTRYPPIVTPGC